MGKQHLVISQQPITADFGMRPQDDDHIAFCRFNPLVERIRSCAFGVFNPTHDRMAFTPTFEFLAGTVRAPSIGHDHLPIHPRWFLPQQAFQGGVNELHLIQTRDYNRNHGADSAMRFN